MNDNYLGDDFEESYFLNLLFEKKEIIKTYNLNLTKEEIIENLINFDAKLKDKIGNSLFNIFYNIAPLRQTLIQLLELIENKNINEIEKDNKIIDIISNYVYFKTKDVDNQLKLLKEFICLGFIHENMLMEISKKMVLKNLKGRKNVQL